MAIHTYSEQPGWLKRSLIDIRTAFFEDAEEVGALVAWLCSEEAGFVTGQIWTVDGGRMAQLSLP